MLLGPGGCGRGASTPRSSLAGRPQGALLFSQSLASSMPCQIAGTQSPRPCGPTSTTWSYVSQTLLWPWAPSPRMGKLD